MLIGWLLIRLISFQDAVAIMVETRNQTCSWSLRYFDESHCWLIQQFIHLIKDIHSGEKLFKVNSKVKKTTTIDFSPKSKLLLRVSLLWWPIHFENAWLLAWPGFQTENYRKLKNYIDEEQRWNISLTDIIKSVVGRVLTL